MKVFRKEFILYCLKNKMPIFQNLANGATMKHIKRSELKRVYMDKPREIIIKEFTKIVSPMLKTVGNLKLKNKVLQQTRDLLLPRLISGKLNIEQLTTT